MNKICTATFGPRKFAVRIPVDPQATVSVFIEEACRILKISYDLDVPSSKVFLRTVGGVDLSSCFKLQDIDLSHPLTIIWPALDMMMMMDNTYYSPPPQYCPMPMPMMQRPPTPCVVPCVEMPTPSLEKPTPSLEKPKKNHSPQGKTVFNPLNIPNAARKFSWSFKHARPFFWMITDVFRDSKFVEGSEDDFYSINKVDLIEEFKMFDQREWTNEEIAQFEIDAITKQRYPPSYMNLEAAAKQAKILKSKQQNVILLVPLE